MERLKSTSPGRIEQREIFAASLRRPKRGQSIILYKLLLDEVEKLGFIIGATGSCKE
jgi:hypothetical protein